MIQKYPSIINNKCVEKLTVSKGNVREWMRSLLSFLLSVVVSEESLRSELLWLRKQFVQHPQRLDRHEDERAHGNFVVRENDGNLEKGKLNQVSKINAGLIGKSD